MHAAYKATLMNGTPRSKLAMRRDKVKRKKINSLQEVLPSPVHSQVKIFLSTRPVFYSGTANRVLPNPIPNAVMLSAIQDLQVINTVSGARMVLASGDTVFIFALYVMYD